MQVRQATPKDRRGMEFFPIVGALLLIQAVSLAARSYFAREALLFVAIAALLVFVAGSLVFLGILLQEAVRGIVRYARKMQQSHPRHSAAVRI